MYIDFREVPIVLRSDDSRLSKFSDASLEHSFHGNVLHKSAVKLLQFALHYFTGDDSYFSDPKEAWTSLDDLRESTTLRAASDTIKKFDDGESDENYDYTVNDEDLYEAYGEVSDMISYKSTEQASDMSKPILIKQRSHTPMDVQVRSHMQENEQEKTLYNDNPIMLFVCGATNSTYHNLSGPFGRTNGND